MSKWNEFDGKHISTYSQQTKTFGSTNIKVRMKILFDNYVIDVKYPQYFSINHT